jgi:hypothetical protein
MWKKKPVNILSVHIRQSIERFLNGAFDAVGRVGSTRWFAWEDADIFVNRSQVVAWPARRTSPCAIRSEVD